MVNWLPKAQVSIYFSHKDFEKLELCIPKVQPAFVINRTAPIGDMEYS